MNVPPGHLAPGGSSLVRARGCALTAQRAHGSSVTAPGSQ
jgi:hypothetical protein